MKPQYIPIPDAVHTLKYRNSSAKYELIFKASELPALGYISYYIEKIQEIQTEYEASSKDIDGMVEIGFEVSL